MRFFSHWQQTARSGLTLQGEERFNREHYFVYEDPITFEETLNNIASMPKFQQVTDKQVEQIKEELKDGTIKPTEVLHQVHERPGKMPLKTSPVEVAEKTIDAVVSDVSEDKKNEDEKVIMTCDTDVPEFDPTYPLGKDLLGHQYLDLMMKCDKWEWHQDSDKGPRELAALPNASMLANALQAISLRKADMAMEEDDD